MAKRKPKEKTPIEVLREQLRAHKAGKKVKRELETCHVCGRQRPLELLDNLGKGLKNERPVFRCKSDDCKPGGRNYIRTQKGSYWYRYWSSGSSNGEGDSV